MEQQVDLLRPRRPPSRVRASVSTRCDVGSLFTSACQVGAQACSRGPQTAARRNAIIDHSGDLVLHSSGQIDPIQSLVPVARAHETEHWPDSPTCCRLIGGHLQTVGYADGPAAGERWRRISTRSIYSSIQSAVGSRRTNPAGRSPDQSAPSGRTRRWPS